MEESKYQPMETYLGGSIDEFSENNNNILVSNSEENITYSQSEHELNINSLFKRKNDKTDESDLLQEKLMPNINTLQSIRISHSLEKSQNSQSLIDIINGVKFDFDDKEKNIFPNNENDINVSNKIKSGSKKEEESFRTNKCVNDSNSNIKNKNSLLSINESILLNKNKTSAMTKYSSNNCNKKNNILSNNNYYNSFNNKSNNNTDNNSNLSNKFKIEEIFKEQFEERIKPKSNKLIQNCETSIKSLRKNNKQNNEFIEKPKTLEYQNKIKKILSLFSSENNSNNLSKKIINKDIEKNVNDNSDKIIKSKKKEKDDLVYLNDSDLISPLKSKELIFSNIDDLNELSLDHNDDDEKSSIIFKSNKKKGLIIDAFCSEDDSDENQDKNVMISELDIELSNSFKINKNKAFKSKKLSNEVIQKNNMKLEKAIELNIKKGQFLNNNYKKVNNINDKNNEYKKTIKNNNKQNKNSDNNIIKKSPNFNKSVKKKIYPKKRINSYRNSNNTKEEKSNNTHLKETNLLKKYKNNSSFVKPKITKKINHIKQNILVNSGSNCSLLALNTSGNQKNNSISKKNTFSTERNKRNQSYYSYTSYSHSKKKKIKDFYMNRPYKKSNNCLSNYVNINKNKNNYLKSSKATSFYSNNDTNRESFLLNIPNISTIGNKNRHNNKANKANSINNDINLYKNNTIYNDNNIYKKNTSFNELSKDFSKPIRNSNSHIIKILDNPTYFGNNLFDNDKSLIKNKKKNDIPICNIKSKIPFKKKIMGKKAELYSNKTKIKKKINSENNVVLRSSSCQNQNSLNSNSSILNEIANNYIPKLNNPLSFICRNNKKITNTIYNSFTNNIRNNIKNNSYKNANNIKKKIINKKNNFSLFINDNDAYNIFKISYIPKKAEKTINNHNCNNSNKIKENILTDLSSITKNFTNIGKMVKNVRNNKKKRLINDKIINKTYIRNVSQKYNSSSINSIQMNISQHKCKINSLMINNKNKGLINPNHNKTPNTSRNNSKNVTVVGPQHFHSILNKFRLFKLEKNKHI
jgi:hypothetical protein